MGAHLDRPQPLKRPIGLRDLIFTEVMNRRVLRLRGHRNSVLLALLAAISVSATLCMVFFDYGDWLLLGDFSIGRVNEEFWYLAISCAAIGEALGWLWGFNTLWFEPQRWRQKGRLAELSLTMLRPFTIGQLILSRGLPSCFMFWGGVLIGSAGGLIIVFPQAALFLMSLLLITINGIVSYYAFSWVAMTLGMSRDPFSATKAYFFFLIKYSLALSVVIGAFFSIIGLLYALSRWDWAIVVNSWWLAAPCGYAIICTIKLLFARAYATKWEQVIFPQLDF